MSNYDDMMGLEFGEFGAFLDGQMIKDALMASAAGGAAILAGAYAVNKLVAMDWMPQVLKDNSKLVKGASMITLGIVGGKYLHNMGNEKAAMGVLGGMGALGVANIINQFLGANSVELSGSDSDEALLSNYGGMSALAALEATSVQESAGAFQGFADPTVTPERLMGFEGPVTQTETLGNYAPYLS